MLTIPYTFTTVGVALGLILYLICSYVSYYTLDIYITIGHDKNIFNLFDLIEYFFGKTARVISDICQILNILGTMVTYIQISNHVIKKSI